MAISGLFSLVMAVALGGWIVFRGGELEIISLVPLIANGGFYVLAVMLYFHVLHKEEVSRAVPWFQSIPLFGVVLASVALREMPSWLTVGAIAMLIIGSFILSVKNGVVKRKMMVLMLASSGLIALYDVVFAKFGRQVDDAHAMFGHLLGIAFWGLLFLVGKQERKGFVLGLRTKFKLQASAETVTLVANALIAFAKLHMPVAVVQAGCATQPVFVLMLALVFNKFYPKVFSEETDKGSLWKKVVSIGLLTVGGIILSTSVQDS